jgi:hypothetical protein
MGKVWTRFYIKTSNNHGIKLEDGTELKGAKIEIASGKFEVDQIEEYAGELAEEFGVSIIYYETHEVNPRKHVFNYSESKDK